MHVAALRLVNFRSYCDASAEFGAGLNIVAGANATGKTNLLEGAWFALRGTSPRTRRDEKLVTWGEHFMRVAVDVEAPDVSRHRLEVAYVPRQGKRLRWDGRELASLDELRGRTQVFIFVPESLLLVKGSPARRRAHLDAFAAALEPQYDAAARELYGVLRQRNAQLLAVKNGASAAALGPWDTQFARAAVELSRRRRAAVEALAEEFAAVAAALAPAGENFVLQLVTQLAGIGDDEDALCNELVRRRPGEVQRGLSLFGPHRDDLRFLEVGAAAAKPAAIASTGSADDAPWEAEAVRPSGAKGSCGFVEMPRGGRDLRLFGSQGEQRAAVLALLLAEQRMAAARTGAQGTLFLDDVMSELDDSRRRLLVRMLSSAGQVVITTTNLHYFTEDELAMATVIELPLDGSLTMVHGEQPAAEGGFGTSEPQEVPGEVATNG